MFKSTYAVKRIGISNHLCDVINIAVLDFGDLVCTNACESLNPY